MLHEIVMRNTQSAILTALICLAADAGFAQDIEPRRWTHLPVGMNIFGGGVVQTQGDIAFDPVLKLEDVTLDMKTAALSYIRAFDLLGKTARFDVLVPYARARWEGLLDGVSASTERTGLVDPRLRLSVNLYGAPALSGQAYRRFRASHRTHTVFGAALAVNLPIGHYEEDKLINLGQNRYVFRPQMGLVHTRGPWSYELTGSVFLYTENNDFFGDQTLEQDPLFAVQSHIIYTAPGSWWFSLSAAHDRGGESTLDGVKKGDRKRDFLYGISAGYSLGARNGIKLAYVASRAHEDIGKDLDYFILSFSHRL
jgi:hypothetical protein